MASVRRSPSIFVVGSVFTVLFISIGSQLIPDLRKVSLLFPPLEVKTVSYILVVLGLHGPWGWADMLSRNACSHLPSYAVQRPRRGETSDPVSPAECRRWCCVVPYGNRAFRPNIYQTIAVESATITVLC
jgi:hypothetical protein